MEATTNLEVLVKGYAGNVRQLERDLSALAQDADELTGEVERHKEARKASQEQRDALERQRASLQGERQSLMGAHAEASFTGDTAQLQTISRRRVQLDKELAGVEEDIRGYVIPSEDFGERCAELTVTKEELSERLPAMPFVANADTLPPLLHAVYKTVREDSSRLGKLLRSIELPAAFKQAVEKTRREKGVKATSSPAWLVEQEKKRRERMERFKDVAGNTDAMHSAMSVSYREPEPRTTATSGSSDGVLSGDEVRRILREKQSA